jgi:hypothetical protein
MFEVSHALSRQPYGSSLVLLGTSGMEVKNKIQ